MTVVATMGTIMTTNTGTITGITMQIERIRDIYV